MVFGDTDVTPVALVGTGGSRAATLANGAVLHGSRELRAKILVAGRRRPRSESPTTWRSPRASSACKGSPVVQLPMAELARIVAHEPERLPEGADTELDVTQEYDGGQSGWSGGTHVAEVEVDLETGLVTIDRYVVIEDCGLPVNPAIVEGQIRGGVAQGIGAVLLEHSAYDDDGQFMASTFMDYLMPTTMDVPNFEIHHVEPILTDPDVNFRGVGEGGMIVAPACITNAIEDALAPLGVKVREQHLPPVADPLARRGGAGMKTPAFEYHAPRTIDEALALLGEHADDAKVLAGGQSLVPLLAMRLARPTQLVDVNEIDELAGIRPIDGTGLAIGALTRERTAEHSPLVAERAPVLAEALPFIGHVVDPQPWDHRRLDRARGRVGGAAGGRGPHGRGDGRAFRAGRAGRAGRRLLRRALHDRRWPTTSC